MSPIRQGDVVFYPVEVLPTGTTKTNRDNRGRIVVQEGEATGHAHAILVERDHLVAAFDPRSDGAALGY